MFSTNSRSILTAARARAAGLVAAAVLILVAAVPAAAAPLPAGSTAILSGASSLFEALPAPVGPSSTARWSVSADGRFVAFASRSDGLVAGDDDYVQNIYVKDLITGAVTFVSRATGASGEPAHQDCFEPAISDDGSRVAFTCDGALDAADTNGDEDVYVRDLASASTTLASRAGGLGVVGDDSSGQPALSADGRYVAFSSGSTNLVSGASNGGQRVYRRELGGANATILVSRRTAALGGAPAPGHQPSISDDGNVIAFTAFDTPVIDETVDTNGVADVYVRDVTAETTVLASRKAGAGAVGNGPSSAPTIAGDGSAVAFESQANQFDFDQDSDTDPDIYWRSLSGAVGTQNTALVSINAAGNKGINSTAPSIDRSGASVGFLSEATGLDPADTDPSADAYVKNVMNNELHVASRADGAGAEVANAGAFAAAVSGDGKKVAVTLSNGRITPDVDPRNVSVILRNLETSDTVSVARPATGAPFLNQGGSVSRSALSADGRFAAFASDAPGLGLPDGVAFGVFVRDRVTGNVVLASRADGPDGTPLAAGPFRPAISADGGRVAFSVSAGADRGVWVRDLAAGRTWLASRADGAAGAPANGISFNPALDADGSRVAFRTRATNLGNGDGDDVDDIHVRDLETGQTILVSRADGANGAKGDDTSESPDLSSDGTRVSFRSFAKTLAPGDTDVRADAYVRDIAAASTRLVSAAPDGTKGDGDVLEMSMDAAGTRVAFASNSTNLLDQTQPNSKVFVRDLATGSLVLASRADGPAGAPAGGDSRDAAISPDGRYVAFSSDAANLAAGLPAGVVQAYRRDLAAGRTELVSRANGAGGTASPRASTPDDISAGGGCVSFRTDGALIAPLSDHVRTYLRALRADCAPADPARADQPAADTLAPVLSGARLSRRRFRVGRAPTALAAARPGTVLRFRSSEAATLRIAFKRAVPGRRGRRPRYRRAGALTRAIAAGPGRVALSGRIGKRRMAPGRYRLTLVATDAAGNRSKAVRLEFRIVKR